MGVLKDMFVAYLPEGLKGGLGKFEGGGAAHTSQLLHKDSVQPKDCGHRSATECQKLLNAKFSKLWR